MTDTLSRQPMHTPAFEAGQLAPSVGVYRRHAMNALALALAFWAPWGEASGTLFGFGFSKIFVVLAALFIVAQAFTRGGWVDVFPRPFNWWVLFLVGHTLIYYLVVAGGDVRFGYSGYKVYQGEVTGLVEEHGVGVARFFLFAAVAYALSRHLSSAGRLQAVAVMYGLGLCAMLLLTSGYYTAEDVGGERFSGGSFNANAFGMTCWTALFLALFLVRSEGKVKLKRMCAVAIIVVAGYGILSSGSRSGLLGVLVGLAALTAFSSLRRGAAVWIPVGFLLVVCVLVALVPDTVLTDLSERIAPARIRETGGAHRLQIWGAYAEHVGEYAFQGVGLNNGSAVVAGDFYVQRPTHNLFLKMLVEFGVAGLALFIFAMWHLFMKARDTGVHLPERAVVLGLVVCWLTNILFHDFMLTRETWVILAFVSAFARNSTIREQ